MKEQNIDDDRAQNHQGLTEHTGSPAEAGRTLIAESRQRGSTATLVSYRIIQTIGIPLIFIPISTLNYVGVPREKFNQVSGISNFTRNVGGAIGVSLLSTIISRQKQTQRSTLVTHTNNANPFFTRQLRGMTESFRGLGMGAADASHKALASMSSQVDLQASVLGFKNAFWLLSILVAFLIPLPFLMRRPTAKEAAAAAASH